ncbi:hypothetical protein FB45DRAFT_1047689 [Roridomyces roridus]|uniref:Uncharacterized protein n=1 Tax=Roridomyces roridus TaxID=1738132 RepID=A0AAD7AWQ2_9AGAR|nr:hypothetical protein FB45DRAFT_1047689 [Roridomyces roridus]
MDAAYTLYATALYYLSLFIESFWYFNATDEFLNMWADAQKLAYSQGAGWMFWNFKVEKSELAGNLSRQWSYLEGIELGYFLKDPTQVHDPHVCDPYVINSTTTA